MKDPGPVDIPFPLQGLHVASAIASQPANTTPNALNVRGYNPRLGRDQGGQRAGLTKYMPVQVNGAAPIQEIDACVSTGAAVNTAAGVGALALTRSTAVGMEVYNNGGVNRFFDTANTCLGTCWDNNSGIAYGAMTDGATFIRITAGKSDGTAVWTSANLPNFNVGTQIGMTIGGGFLWVATLNVGATATFVYKLNPANGTILNGGVHVYTTSNLCQNGAVAYQNGILAIGYVNVADLLNVSTLVAVNVPQANILNAVGNLTDVDVDGQGFFYFTGISAAGRVAKIDGNGNNIWLATANTGGSGPTLAYDPINNVVVYGSAVGGAGKITTLSPKDGTTVLAAVTVLASTAIGCVRISGLGGYAVECTVGGNTTIGNVTSAGVTVWSATVAMVSSARSLSVNQGQGALILSTLSPRYVRGIAVAGGTVVRILSGVGVVSITGGSGALSPTASVIFSAQQGQQLYFADGVAFKYYDAPTDSIKTLVASSGSLPTDSHGNAPRLVTVWRNRLVFSGLPFDPLNWFMSAVGDPTNWNYNPTPQVETQAVAGNNATAGQSPDIINMLIPYNDETLFFMGDHSIWQMTMDPAAGGRIDLVTSAVGGAFGQAWCRDGMGILYFVSSRGSVYKFAPGGLPERISDPIAELLLTIPMGTSICRMEWEERIFTVHLYITPTTGPATTFHYEYDIRNGSWWQKQFANNLHNPIATHAMDGDQPGDRVILLGGQDGFIRKVDLAALDDDGTAINSFAYLGPVRNPGLHGITMNDLQCTMDTNSSPVTYNVYAGPDPESALVAVSSANGTFSAGRNHSQAVMVFGQSQWVKLASNTAAQAWALEYLKARVKVPEGPTRQRIF